MGFKEVVDLDCNTTTALGGRDKTGKPNPTQIEGYYLGSKDVASRKSKGGFAKLHILQTSKGNVGIWGKTDLDRKMRGVTGGYMIRITQAGSVPTPNGDMYKFKVEVDSENTIEVSFSNNSQAEESSDSSSYSSSSEDDDLDGIDSLLDEPTPAQPVLPRVAASAPSPDRQARVQALLNKGRARTA